MCRRGVPGTLQYSLGAYCLYVRRFDDARNQLDGSKGDAARNIREMMRVSPAERIENNGLGTIRKNRQFVGGNRGVRNVEDNSEFLKHVLFEFPYRRHLVDACRRDRRQLPS